MIYIATPYSARLDNGEPDNVLMAQRYIAACRVAAKFINAGNVVFCPIAHSHPIAVLGAVDQNSHDVWLPLDMWYLERADKVVVVKMDGWGASIGVAHEIDRALELGIPVEYIPYEYTD